MFCPDFYEELVICGGEGRLLACEKVDLQQQKSPETSVSIHLGEEGASRTTKLGYPAAIERSGHHGATYYEHIAFLDRLEGKIVDSATPLQGLWAMIVASAAQESIASGAPIEIADYIEQHKLVAVLSE